MNSGRVANSNVGSRQNVKLSHQITQSAYSTFLFTVLSNDDWVAALQRGAGIYLYFGTFAGLTIFKAGIYFYDLIESKNKNMGKVFSFIREFISAAILTIAIIGGLAASTAIAAITPWLFVISVMINVLYNLGVAIHNAYYWAKNSDNEAKNHYKANFKKHMISATFGIIATVALSLLMIANIVPMAMAIISASLNVIGFVVGVCAVVHIYKANKNAKANLLDSTPTLDPDAIDNTSTSSINMAKPGKLPSTVSSNSLTQHNDDYYFYCKNRTDDLLQQNDPRNYLLQEINQKLDSLDKQVFRDHDKFFSQQKKRLVKMKVLVKLKSLLLDSTKTLEDLNVLLNEPEFNNSVNNPFQSFFRKKSDTQNIFETAEVYFVNLEKRNSIRLINI